MAQKTTRKKTAASRAVRDKRGQPVVWQRPNIWLIGWALVSVLWISGVAGESSKLLFGLGLVLLIVWALLELLRGVNLFRRVLGGLVLGLLLAFSKYIYIVLT